ncbi:SRPBCC domain-containing protein [Plantactinospora sp. S1510]|uniref:SRPBCC domain-containing protein n=1 Tax=Plantactinospora alkalitolerans TaxID=2789879 RepID=A0ABS0GUB9_9ACTN|nr:SRPBCC domain-containing protein [Plantactinospora alkalitolerans]MBF9129812.1 SRPBCC domain-containing protein [Plantactinospora alkalitolerans]
MSEQPKPYRVETTIGADRDTVWRAMTDAVQIREWFGWDHGDLDGEIQYIFVDHAKQEPPERMLFDDGSYLELVPDGHRTTIRAVLPGSLDGTDWDDVYDGMEEGWRSFFEQLRFLLEIRPQGRRRTIYLTGTAAAAEVLAIVGTDGQPWHTSRYQQITVNQAGHLLVVAAQAPLTGDAEGPISLTITTYGLDDAAFAAVLAEWTAHWTGVPDAKVTTKAGESTVTI